MIIREGKARIYAPNVNPKGPGRVEGVFYNRAMVFNRDTTIFILHNLNLKTALDGLAATGVRGIRIALENGVDVTTNDWSPEAVRVIERNAGMNSVDIRITQRNVNSLLAEERFDYADIDPFGSPVPFIDMALLSAKVLGITATDTATLGGRNRRVERRYLSDLSSPQEYVHELGVRNLLGYVGRMAARMDRGIKPILSVWHGHFYRIYVRILKGSGRAKSTLESIGRSAYGGPIWLGELHDFSFLSNSKIPELPMGDKLSKMLEIWREERGFLFYHIPTLASEMKVSTPPMAKIILSLREMGFHASRTQFSQQGIRTDAPLSALRSILGEVHK